MSSAPSPEMRDAVARLRELSERATPGPWHTRNYKEHGSWGTNVTAPKADVRRGITGWMPQSDVWKGDVIGFDAELIVTAVNFVRDHVLSDGPLAAVLAERAPVATGEVVNCLACLDLARTTASNDDLSKPGTTARERHVARLFAVQLAADLLTRQAAELEDTRRERDDLSQLVDELSEFHSGITDALGVIDDEHPVDVAHRLRTLAEERRAELREAQRALAAQVAGHALTAKEASTAAVARTEARRLAAILDKLLIALASTGQPMSDAMWANVGDDAPVNGRASVEQRALHRAASEARTALYRRAASALAGTGERS